MVYSLFSVLSPGFLQACLCLLLSGCAGQALQSTSSVLPNLNEIEKPQQELGLMQELADWDLHASVTPQTLDSGLQPAPSLHLTSVQLVSMPIEQVLLNLAHDAKLALQINQPIAGSVTLLASNQTLEQILTQLAQQVPISWDINSRVLAIWGDQPYTESYAVNYLNLDRSTRSRVGLATQVGTINAVADGGNSGISNSSQTSLENSADHHFWTSLAIDMDGLVARDGKLANASYTMNRDAGIVTLHAAAPLHKDLKKYLLKLNANAQRQVLIEATVVEVALSNDFQAGVDWQLVANGNSGISAAQVFSGAPIVNAESVGRITAPNGLMSLVQNTNVGTVSGTLNLLEQFGDVRILSKPRIIALNNQSSVLKVVDNRVYFTVNVERARSENKDEVITETEIHTVPVGLVMNVTPYIDKLGGVMLNVRPTLSRILGFVDDPNPELAAANVRNSVPEIQVREMESMLRVNSGDVAIIGGLMQDIQDGSDKQLPGLGSIPVLGSLFKQTRKLSKQTELLIVLKPTVLES